MARLMNGARARFGALGTLAFCFLLPLAASAEIPSTPEARQAVLEKLQWQGAGKYQLTASKSSLDLPADYGIIQGAGAVAFYEAINGVNAPASLEAVILDPKAGDIVLFKSIREGYVKFDDWSDVDADGFLESMKEGTEEANKERAKHNVSPLKIIGWRQKPTLDPTTKTVSWALDLENDEGKLVNASVLIFSRYGYEQLTWAGDAKDDPNVFLSRIRAAYDFDAGARYGDFQPNDKVAEYGIATLVAGLVGAKVAAKFGLLALALVFLKKAWILVVIALSGVGAFFKRLFGRRSPAVAAPPPPSPQRDDAGGSSS
ncbi:MAG TPA: DUF2167 domain-containing protein [Stellaceae bacterium]|nr:DUF2167 domain-containing protein [Stellaceae bacterium]